MNLYIALSCLALILLLGYQVPPIAAGILIGATWGAAYAWHAHRRYVGRRLRKAGLS